MINFKNKIFLIGGATGVSKSTLSFKLMKKHNIIHKLGTGFIREMAKNFLSKKKLPELYTHSFETNLKDPLLNLHTQSVPLKKMIKHAINRANREGTSMIIEGVNLIPGLMEFANVDKKILLIAKNEKKHFEMIQNNNTHKLREISKKYLKNIRSIQQSLILRAKKYKWQIIDVTKNK